MTAVRVGATNICTCPDFDSNQPDNRLSDDAGAIVSTARLGLPLNEVYASTF